MAKTFKLPIGLELERSGAAKMANAIQDVQKAISGKVSKEISGQFDEALKQVNAFSKSLEKLDGVEMSINEYNKINGQLIDYTKNLDVLFKLTSKGMSIKVDSKELDAATKKVAELEAKLESSSEKQVNLGAKYGTAGSRKLTGQEGIQNDLLKSFPESAGSLKGMDIKSISKNIVHLDTMTKKVKEAIAEYDKLSKITDKDKSASDKARFKILNDEIKTLKTLDVIVDNNNNKIEKGTELYQKQHKETEKLRQELEKARDAQTQISEKVGATSPVTKASSSMADIRDDARGAKASQSMKFSAEESKGAEKEGPIEDTLSSAAMDDLIKKFFSWRMAIDLAKTALRETIKIIGDLDKAFVNIAVVTQYTNKEVWGMYGNFKRIAQESGFMVSEIGKVAGEYFRQGESYTNVLLLTEAAAKAAKVAGIDAAESVDYLTSAVRGYSLAATDAMMVSDKFAAIAAGTATSYEGMATAFSKVAAQAYASNVEFDSLMGMMATAMEVTQEAPENIGTAFKTIFARMTEIKEFGTTLEDGVDSNRIETSLKTVGVQLFDTTGQMRALDDVLLEVGARWKGLTQTQKAYLATTLAGSRQQTRLLAVFENYDKTLKNIEISANSLGATEAQQLKNTESMEHALNGLNVAYESIVTTVTSNTAVIEIISALGTGVEAIGSFLDTIPGKAAAFGAAIPIIGIFALSLKDTIKSTKGAVVLFEKFGAAKKLLNVGEYVQNFKFLNETLEKRSFVNYIKGMLGLNVSMKTTEVATGKTTIAVNSLDVSLKSLAATAALVAGVALVFVGVAIAIAKATDQAAKVKKLSDSISELNGEIYNLKETKSNLADLVTEYELIEGQVHKTNKELERQAEILKLLNDLDISGNYNFEINGKLDKKSLEDFEKSQQKLLQEATSKKVEAGVEMSTKRNLTGANKRIASESVAMQAFGSSDRYNEGFRTAMSRDAERGQTSTATKAVYESGLGMEIDLEKWNALSDTFKEIAISIAETDLDLYKEVLMDSEFDSTGLTEQISLIAETKDTLDLSSVSAQEYANTMRSAAGVYYDALLNTDAYLQTAENWKSLTNTTVDELVMMDKAFAASQKHSIELSESIKKSLVEAFDQNGYEGFFNGLTSELKKADASIVDTINYTMELVDVFDSMPEDMLLNQLQSFDSMEDRLTSFNAAMDNFNTASLRELLELTRQYPEHADAMLQSLQATGQVSDTVQKDILKTTKDRMKEELKDEITQNEARIEILKAKKESLVSMSKDQALIEEMAANTSIDITNLTAESIIDSVDQMGKKYEHHFNSIIEMANQAGRAQREALKEEGLEVGMVSYKGGEGFKGKFGKEDIEKRITSIKNSYEDSIKSVDTQIKGLTDTNNALGLALGAIDNNTWNKSAKEMEKAGKEAKKAADKLEIYTGVLNKMYVAQQRLAAVNFGMDLMRTKRAYQEAASAADSLVGAKKSLSDSSYAQTVNDEYGALDIYGEQLRHIIKVTGEYHNNLQNKLSPSLKGTYQIIAGKVIPVSDKYKKLTAEQMKELDEFAKSFNDLTGELQGYQKELYTTKQAQNELLTSMRDTVIEYQELLIDAIKNEEKKQLDSFKKIIDANKKYIEERKKLYEKSFDDEDDSKEAESIEEQRKAVIEKLAALESAHDVTSAQRKLEYRQQLQDLDDQYNMLMLERNREALLESLDNQSEYQDDIYTREEEAYQKRIESGEWLEKRLKQVQDEARLQAIIDNMKQHWTIQQMLDAGYITQEEITAAGITDMNQTISDLSDDQLAIFTDSWMNNRDVIDEMWNGAEGEVGAEKLSKDAMDNILEYLKTHSTQMEGKTSLMKDKVTDEWKGMLEKVNEYTDSFNAITLKSPSTSGVTTGLSNMVNSIESYTNSAAVQYDRLIAKAGAAAKAVEDSARKMALANNTKPPTEPKPEPPKKGGGGGAWGGDTMQMYATGGTTERTGFHWLDGEAGRPERVLSPGQNIAFESMLQDLSQESKRRMAGDEGSVSNDQVVEAIHQLIQATYETETDIKPLVDAMRNSKTGSSLGSVISNRGITVNRSGGSK